MCMGRAELDRIYANAEMRDTLDKTFGVLRVGPEDKPWPETVYGTYDYYRDEDDEG